MLKDIKKNKIFTRRALIIGMGQSALATALIGRLGYLQLWKGEEYLLKSDNNRIKTIIKTAPRGNIHDRYGVALTGNKNTYRLLFYLQQKKEAKVIIDKLSKIIDIPPKQKQSMLKKIATVNNRTVISLIDNLSWQDLAKIEAHSHELSGLATESGVMRYYPYPEQTAHFLGYVSLPSEEEISENGDPALFMHPDFRIGKIGIERSFDEFLRGRFGANYVEVDSKEVILRKLSSKPSKDGSKLDLTIDFELQNYVYDLIKDSVASVVVMDVHSGDILSYASTPSFDTNNFVEGVSKDYWQQITSDPLRPLNNKPIAAVYPPGSTFKLIVTIAALEAGIKPTTEHYCKGHHMIGRRRFNCWEEKGHGKLDMDQAIARSCNVYFYKLAQEIGYDSFAKVARRFGYGEKFAMNLYGANAGNIPNKEWKKKIFKESWMGGDTINAAIGQGFILASPLQIALVTARIANGGYAVDPKLVLSQSHQPRKRIFKKRLAKSSHLDFVKKAMFNVVNDKKGTAYYQRVRIDNFKMAGKTGTSQVISKREKDRKKLGKNIYENHAIFTGFAPYHNPKYSISVFIEHGKSGSGAAAPIAKKIFTKMAELEALRNKANQVS